MRTSWVEAAAVAVLVVGVAACTEEGGEDEGAGGAEGEVVVERSGLLADEGACDPAAEA